MTNHRPLIIILNEQTLDIIENPRLHRLKEKLAGYRFITQATKKSQFCKGNCRGRVISRRGDFN